MPVNRNALLRYKTIDRCLQNRFRKWTLDDLVDACSNALYEYEGIDKGVSKRTVQGDLQTMRSDKLGYNAPIIVVDKRYYTYKDRTYSITNSPLTDQDLSKLSEAVAVMKQFQGFSHFQDLNTMVQKLEDQIHAQQTHTQPVIDFERNDNLKGLNFLDALYRAIVRQQTLEITYQSFKARKANAFLFYPYLLKEFRNRWFVFGNREGTSGISSLALDRIHELHSSVKPFKKDPDFDPTTYFTHVIGVSRSPQMQPEKVRLLVAHKHAPYVLTKPLHHSQELISQDYQGVIVELTVQLNFELEKLILGFGEGIQVLTPNRLRRNIKERLQTAVEIYQQELTNKGVRATHQRLQYKGYATFNRLYSTRSVRQFQKQYDRLYQDKSKPGIPDLLQTYPRSAHFLFQRNLMRLLTANYPNAIIVDSHYYTTVPYQKGRWQQQIALPIVKIASNAAEWTEETTRNVLANTFSMYICLESSLKEKMRLELLSGSHQKLLSTQQCQLLGENSCAYQVDFNMGTGVFVNDLVVRRLQVLRAGVSTRIVYLRFSDATLPEGWAWKLEKAFQKEDG
jgi:predicted DNA-binding transcriptional regulator YafY